MDLLRSTFPGATSNILPLAYATLQEKVDNYFQDEYQLKRSVLKFPTSFSSSKLNIYEDHYVDILTLIGDMLLDVSEDDLHLAPLVLDNSNDSAVIR